MFDIFDKKLISSLFLLAQSCVLHNPRSSMRNWRRLRRSKRLKKNVRFENDVFAKEGKPRKIRAIRSLFTSCSFCELPNEVVSVILSYFTATELMRLRCVSTVFFFVVANEILSNRMNFYGFKLLALCIPK